MKQYTSVEQSKKLLKLGIGSETADMIHWRLNVVDYWKTECMCWLDSVNSLRRKNLISDIEGTSVEIVPCWSLGSLMQIIPKVLYDTKSNLKVTESLREFVLEMNVFPHHEFCYNLIYIAGDSQYEYLVEKSGKTLFDAAYELLLWILEHGYAPQLLRNDYPKEI